MGKSSWVPLRVYFPLLQMIFFIMASTRVVSTLRVMRTRPPGMVSVVVSHLLLLWVVIITGYINFMLWTYVLKLCCFCYLNSVCNNYGTPMYEILMNWCNLCICCAELLWSWLVAGWFEILRDFSELSELYGLKFGILVASVIKFCTCALIIWTVLGQHWYTKPARRYLHQTT
jgi:hypothetical protein